MKQITPNKKDQPTLFAKQNIGKHTLSWAKGKPVQVHCSRVIGKVTVLDNPDKRTDEQILRKLRTLCLSRTTFKHVFDYETARGWKVEIAKEVWQRSVRS